VVSGENRLNGTIEDCGRPTVFGDSDRLLAFTVTERNVRGRLMRLGPSLTAILHAHEYPPLLAKTLAEALTVTALLGDLLRKSEGEITVQAQSDDGPVDLLVCDYRAGALRGYMRFDAARVAQLTPESSLDSIFGKAYLAITLEQSASDERYQGIVPLEGDSFAHAFENYFAQSEQIPTLIRVGLHDGGEAGFVAGGMIVQHLPQGEHGGPRLTEQPDHPDWSHVRILSETLSAAELTDPALPLEDLLWRLFHEDPVHLQPATPVSRGCRCSPARIRDVLSRFPASEVDHMRTEDGKVHVDCQFCARSFPIEI